MIGLVLARDRASVASVEAALAARGHDVERVATLDAAAASLARRPAALVVIDAALAAGDVAACCARVHEAAGECLVVVFGDLDEASVAAALAAGADDVWHARIGEAGLRTRVLVAERACAQRTMLASHERRLAFQAKVIENANDAIVVTDENIVVLSVNPAAERLYGWRADEIVGRAGLLHTEPLDVDRETVLREMRERGEFRGEFAQTRRDGQVLYVEATTFAVPYDGQLRFVNVNRDVTARRRAEEALREARDDLERRVEARTAELVGANEELRRQIEERKRTEEALRRTEHQLRHSQKMEAVGRLAGGIAHDFNNVLMVILGCVDLAARRLPESDPVHEDLVPIREAAERAADLTRQLLAFSRQQIVEPRLVDVNEVISRMDKMVRRVIGEDVELLTTTTEPLWTVKADPSQLEQVLLNLAVNARDAMPSGGKLTIETANVELDEAYAREHLGVRPGPHVMLAVSDTGVGMDAATQARIFEPFFTTKERGRGTGLGLSTVFGIVQQSGGSIWLYSEPGRGTTFKIYLPRADEHASEPRAPATVAPPPRRGIETILLVEDDARVRRLVRRVLEERGYAVLDAHDAASAIAISEAHRGGVDLLLTDVVMPRMNGRELAERLSAARPGMRVLFMSGYTGNVVVHHGVLDAGVAFLQKPIMPDVLLRRVRDVLDAVETH